MKKQLMIIRLAFLAILITACNGDPAPINYGADACHFCKMTIVDNQHAAQIVTTKGRNYKYDAIECMVHDLHNWDRPEADRILVADYAAPGVLSDAQNASFLISKEIPSPMGAFLSAFENKAKRDETHKSLGGERLNWEQVKVRLNQNEMAKD